MHIHVIMFKWQQYCIRNIIKQQYVEQNMVVVANVFLNAISASLLLLLFVCLATTATQHNSRTVHDCIALEHRHTHCTKVCVCMCVSVCVLTHIRWNWELL